MEHSALHAFELIGQVIALGGVFLMWGILWPAKKSLGETGTALMEELQSSIERWIFHGALMAATASFINLFVEVAEVQGETIFGGVNMNLFAQFTTGTVVGRREVARTAALLVTTMATLMPNRAAFIFPARLMRAFKWVLITLSILTSIFLTSMISHSAAQPTNRIADIAAQMAHIVTVALWMGILIHLLAMRRWIEGEPGRENIRFVAEIIRRFSPLALTVITLLFVSGMFMASHLVGSVGALLTSAYGLLLLIKLGMLVPALFAGSVNFRVIRPQLIARAKDEKNGDCPTNAKTEVLKRFGRMLELEVTAGVLVILLAGILASVSPPGESGVYRLSKQQARALLSPSLPAAEYINPATFYDAPERTLADMRYAEFTHHWSGVMVCALGIFWLLQSVGGRLGKWAAAGWPLLLIPFMLLVLIASDPEVWLLRRVSPWKMFSDPQLLEHKMGGMILLVLVWLGWRDRRKPPTNRPLGYSLPIICILGGALLLGHVHSMVNSTEDVTNLISYQHVIFGAFMVFAGLIRWLSLRGLFPMRAGDFIWPSLILGLGIFMAFFYREVV